MTSLRTTLSATALAAALLAAFASTAWSHDGQRHEGHRHEGHAGHGMKEGERGPRAHDRHMSELKTQLQLTPAQEGAWAQFQEAMRPSSTLQRPDYEALMKLPTPERLDQMRAMHQQHLTQMDQRAQATKAFYATLTAEQKKRFDEQTARMMAGHGGKHRSGPAHHHGHHGHHS